MSFFGQLLRTPITHDADLDFGLLADQVVLGQADGSMNQSADFLYFAATGLLSLTNTGGAAIKVLDGNNSIYTNAVGQPAGLTSGNGNVGYGVGTCISMTTAANNAAFGLNAGLLITEGANNMCVGALSGAGITTNSNNTLVGALAGATSNTIGITAVGTLTGNHTSADNSVFMGVFAGDYTSGTFQVGIGYQALEGTATFPVTGQFNAALGYQAGQGLRGQIGSVALGYRALAGASFAGNYNTASGYEAGDNVGGTGNVISGYQAGRYLNSDVNVAIGYQAATFAVGSQRTVNNGIFIGYQAGQTGPVTAVDPIFIGYQSGQAATGVNCTFVGTGTGKVATGGQNCFFGNASGTAITTSTNNAFFGFNTGKTITEGISNTIIGSVAAANAGTDADRNTIVGAAAGDDVSGDFNCLFGVEAGENIGAGSSDVFLGYQAGRNESGSDLLYIANTSTATPLIWGDFSAEEVKVHGDLQVANVAEGGTGSLNLRTTREVHTLAAANTSDTTTITIPTGAILVGASFNVNTVITTSSATDTWEAAYVTGSTTALAPAGTLAALNTKSDVLVVSEISTAATEIRFTAPGAETFTAGVIEVVAYYYDLTSIANV